ncbi:MAG: four helix bundle protein [Cyclobacteriaceae bacterium]
MRDFMKYEVWKNSIDLVSEIYRVTSDFPEEEKFGLTNQMRRCAISIPSNIAEGSSRSSEKDFKRFLEIAIGSSFELKSQLIISANLKFIDQGRVDQKIIELDKISKQLNDFISKLKSNN